MTDLIAGDELVKHFPLRSSILRRVIGHVRAVDGASLRVASGSTVGLVGESGSGKSTLGRLLVRLLAPTEGSVSFDGHDITELGPRELRPLRREMQVVFQDPFASMDPLASVGNSLEEPLQTHLDLDRGARAERVGDLLHLVGLKPEHRNRYPREFSGGQLQRIAIARALALDPKLLVLDEPVSSLDVSIQADVINLLVDLQSRLGLTYLFIAHDLALVRHISDRIAVMYLGRIVEDGPAAEVYDRPKHPYTQALLSAIPVPHPQRQRSRTRIVLEGDIPSPIAPPRGCRFHTRCPHVMDHCRTDDPEGYTTPDGTLVHCHLHTSGPALAGDTVLTISAPSARPAAR